MITKKRIGIIESNDDYTKEWNGSSYDYTYDGATLKASDNKSYLPATSSIAYGKLIIPAGLSILSARLFWYEHNYTASKGISKDYDLYFQGLGKLATYTFNMAAVDFTRFYDFSAVQFPSLTGEKLVSFEIPAGLVPVGKYANLYVRSFDGYFSDRIRLVLEIPGRQKFLNINVHLIKFNEV